MTSRNPMMCALSSVLLLGGIAVAQNAPTPAPALDANAAPAEVPSVTEYVKSAPPQAAEVVVSAAPAIECCPISVLGEHAAPSAKRMYRCHGTTQQVLCVDNPADCCCKYFSVPVCVPCCCTGEPVCCDKKVGLLGRGYVTYRWPCGFEATIAFRVHGGVLITYR